MINIIKHGNTYNSTVCSNCECEFTYTKTDIHICDGVKEVRCPECDKCVIVGETISFNY